MDNATGPGHGAADAGNDWRSSLPPEARSRIVNRIMETLTKHLPVTVPEGLIELEKIAVRFEDKIYTAATTQSDYLRKISLKMLSMESQSQAKTQQNLQNVQVVQDQRPRSLAPSGSTSRTSYPGAVALKEELYQMNKTLKDKYVEGLGDLYEMSRKLPVDNQTTPQEPTNQQEEVKRFKSMSERSLQSLEMNKSCVQPSVEESIPTYKRHIMSVLNSEEWTAEKKFEHSAGQAPGTNSSGTQHALGTLPPERSNVKRLKPSLKDDIHN